MPSTPVIAASIAAPAETVAFASGVTDPSRQSRPRIVPVSTAGSASSSTGAASATVSPFATVTSTACGVNSGKAKESVKTPSATGSTKLPSAAVVVRKSVSAIVTEIPV